jgi:hypothetical protein
MAERGVLPKAYLRIDPNIDQAKPGYLATFMRMLCAAHRQPIRGRFKSRQLLEQLLGKANAGRVIAEGDVRLIGKTGSWYVVGWDEWQEGDVTVGERQRRIRADRAKRAHPSVIASRKSNARVTDKSRSDRYSDVTRSPSSTTQVGKRETASGRKGREAASHASPALSPVELAVDDLLAPRRGTPAQRQTMVDLAAQLGERRVLSVIATAAGQPNAYGAALSELQEAARHLRNGKPKERRDPDTGQRVAANGTLLSPPEDPDEVNFDPPPTQVSGREPGAARGHAEGP